MCWVFRNIAIRLNPCDPVDARNPCPRSPVALGSCRSTSPIAVIRHPHECVTFADDRFAGVDSPQLPTLGTHRFQTLLVPHKGDAEPHLPDLPAPKVTATRYRPKQARCVQVRNGVRKVVNCPAAQKKPAARQPVKQEIKG